MRKLFILISLFFVSSNLTAGGLNNGALGGSQNPPSAGAGIALTLNDDVCLNFGTDSDVCCKWNSTDARYECDSPTFILDPSGNRIGMGTTNPATKLHLSSGTLLIDGDAAMSFQVNGSTFIILSSGLVGMGTTDPLAAIHLEGTGIAAEITIDNTDGKRWRLLSSVDGGFVFRDQDATSTRMKIDTDGNIGIGSVQPTQKIHMSSGTLFIDGDAVNSFKIGVSSFIVTSAGNVGIGTTNLSEQLEVAENAVIGGSMTASSFWGDGSNLSGIGSGGWVDDGGVVRLETAADKVGIGTTEPQGSLHVVGIVYHTGGIISTGTTGDIRGAGATDLQTTRNSATMVASGAQATIGGGERNTASGDESTVVGGFNNTASNLRSVVAGGSGNTSDGLYSFTGGGLNNTASGQGAVALGGSGNTALGLYGITIGGRDNLGQGDYSLAAGYGSQATGQGSFVWTDSRSAGLLVTTTDTFTVDSQNGIHLLGGNVGIRVNDPDANLEVASNATALGYAVNISSPDGSSMMAVTGNGHLVFAGAAPTLSSCGTSPSVAGNDTVAHVTVGTSESDTCTVTFAQPFTNKPVCSCDDDSAVQNCRTQETTTTLTMTGTWSDNEEVDFQCFGYR